MDGGETGIRTLGTQAHNGFRDRPNRPLWHLSARVDTTNAASGSAEHSQLTGAEQAVIIAFSEHFRCAIAILYIRHAAMMRIVKENLRFRR